MVRTLPIIFVIFIFFTVSCVTDDDPECDINNPCEDGFTCINEKCVETIVEIVDLGKDFKTHTLECPDNPCGLFVYGWEQDVSYAYPGGLDFELLSQN
ncbi:MAG TPA: hypothetical protein ENN58_01100 [bacterium]|nr:hypothetical protein [bacterium]